MPAADSGPSNSSTSPTALLPFISKLSPTPCSALQAVRSVSRSFGSMQCDTPALLETQVMRVRSLAAGRAAACRHHTSMLHGSSVRGLRSWMVAIPPWFLPELRIPTQCLLPSTTTPLKALLLVWGNCTLEEKRSLYRPMLPGSGSRVDRCWSSWLPREGQCG